MRKILNKPFRNYEKLMCLVIILLCILVALAACTSKTVEHGLRAINTDGFGILGNKGIDRMIDTGEYMYLGADNPDGTIVYRSNDKGETWEAICNNGINGNTKNEFTTTIVWFNDMLYVGTWQLQGGAQMFRANANAANVNDIKWETISEDGFGNVNNNGFTNGIVFDGYIYVGCFNLTEGSEIWRSNSGDAGTWEICIPKGYNRTDNSDSTVFYVYDGYLYVGTESVRGNISDWKGTGLYRTSGGQGEITWEQVNPNGYGDVSNNNTAAITVFNGYMYAGTWNYFGMQIWRTDMKGELPWKWEKVLTGGFGNVDNHACQGLQVVDGKLFAGSCGSLRMIKQSGVLLSTSDGSEWAEVTQQGFIDETTCGVLWMLSSNKKLYIGTFAGFGAETGTSQLWVYE